MKNKINQLEEKIGINFKNRSLLIEAFTHRSYLNEHPKENFLSNERLEFLGDSILGFLTSKTLYLQYPNLPEGTLTNMRTKVVNTRTLAKIASELSLGDFLLLSRGEELGGGRKNKTLLANTFEALLGAIFLEKGLSEAEKFLNQHLKDLIKNLGRAGELKDPKSLLQEKIQARIKESPEYKVLEEEGPDHNKTFVIGVFSQGVMIGKGKGSSKQEAEEKAAQNALENYKL